MLYPIPNSFEKYKNWNYPILSTDFKFQVPIKKNTIDKFLLKILMYIYIFSFFS